MSANSRNHDKEMAAYMKQHPGRYPDSATRPWSGNGSDLREMARTMGAGPNNSSKWQSGMLGGVLAARLGLGSSNVPAEFLGDARKAAA